VFDELQFLHAGARLDFFLSRDGARDVPKGFKVNQAIDTIAFGEPAVRLLLCCQTRRSRLMVTPV